MNSANPNLNKIQQLLNVAIVLKLKQSKGINQVKKLANYVEQKSIQTDGVIMSQESQTYLLFLIQGELQVFKSKNNETQVHTISKNEHYLVEKNVIKLKATSQSMFYLLKEKYIIQIFEGTLSLPFITARLKELRKNQIFSSMQRRKIVKIAFDLQQFRLKIGSKLEAVSEEDGEIKRYCYYIIEGQIKIFKQGFAVCVLGPKQIFGLSQEQAQVCGKGAMLVGKTVTELTHVYKVSSKLILDIGKEVQDYVDKRIKWRESRLYHIDKVSKSHKQKSKQLMKQKASFIDKEIVMKSFYGNKVQDLVRLKQISCKSDIKCQSRQQFYSRKLDKIQNLQKTRYGKFFQTVVLFPMPASRTYQRRNISSSSINRKRSHTEPIDENLNLNETKKKFSFFATNF